MKSSFLILILFSITASISSETTETNFIESNTPYTNQELSDFISSHEQSFVFLHRGHRSDKAITKKLKNLSKKKELLSVRFLSVPFDSSENKEKTSEFKYYYKGTEKTLPGILDWDKLEIWAQEMVSIHPLRRESFEDIDQVDKHFFLLTSPKFLESHDDEINRLAKLIHPTAIYVGFEDIPGVEEVGDLIESGIVRFSSYTNSLEKVPLRQNLVELAKEIRDNEFPPIMKCNDLSVGFVINLKVQTLLYFAESEQDPKIELIQKSIENLRTYFIFIVLTPQDHSKPCQFLQNFSNISPNEIRIIDLSSTAKRFRMIGSPTLANLNFFINSYIEGKLMPFKLNESLPEFSQEEIPKINYEAFKSLKNDLNNAHLVYVYSSAFAFNQSHMEALSEVKQFTKKSKNLKIEKIDHDLNDLTGRFSTDLPKVVFSNSKGKIFYLPAEGINSKNLMLFMSKSFRSLQVEDPNDSDL